MTTKKTSKKKVGTKAKTTAKTAKTAAAKDTVKKAAKTLSVNTVTPGVAKETIKKMERNVMNTNKQFEKFSQDAANIGQEQVEALVKSGTILAKGMENILKACMDIAQSSGEKSQEAAKTLMTCKTLNELTEVQTKLAQDSFDNFMTTATKLSEMSIKVATESMEPINDQVGKAMKKAAA